MFYGGAIITRHKQPKVAILHPSSQAGAFYRASCTQHTARMCFLVLSQSISTLSRQSVLARPVLWPLVSINVGLNCSVGFYNKNTFLESHCFIGLWYIFIWWTFKRHCVLTTFNTFIFLSNYEIQRSCNLMAKCPGLI